MHNARACIGLLVVMLLAAGCGDRRILERTGFIQSTSHDLLPDGKIKYAISLPIATPDIKVKSEYLRTAADSAKEARIILARKTNLLLVSGQLRTALFGISLAQKSIWEHMDTLIRDPTISEQVKIIVVNGDADKLLEKKYREFPRTAQYIDRLIEKEAKGNTIPETTMYSFSRDYYDDGIDPIAPVIKDAGDSIIVDGIGLFRDGQYVDKIDPSESIVFSFLLGSFKHGEISFDLRAMEPRSKAIMLSSLNSTRKVSVEHGADGPRNVVINVNVKASVLEYIGELDPGNEADRHKLEQVLSKNLTQRAQQTVKFLQEKKLDSIGIGKYVRNSMDYAEWKKLNWRDEFSNLNVSCNIKLKIKDYGFRR
ncbi:Ger(x)C family spore germination protein [Paenibacillus mesophilus]|uniref:Ger(x)C family spore germination protein n=1 Tax=Paenibacillus mesophilus TaxID=2582849 RepID=UPI00110E978E|nr:Ger(x)C family spore germination protein [Paenibacillus mesophilus]TMV52325.1 Ger(x)C family spore germination protein [Paenibacillus mesophilus]